MPYLPSTYMELEPPESDYGTAQAVVLPVPFERTTSWGPGTAEGPRAILEASRYLELYDEELDAEPWRHGIATLPPFVPQAFDMGEALEEIRTEARRVLEDGKLLVTLGGEHSLTAAPVKAAGDVLGDPGAIGVVQLDAHADLRTEYKGTPHNHACVMRRVVEAGFPVLAVGIRSLTAPEASFVRERRLPVLWGHDLADPEQCRERFAALLEGLPESVYLTFDLDFFDPSVVPATGTPEPGGGTWYPTLALLRELFAAKRVVAMDVVELAPLAGEPASDFLAAKLIYKCLGYAWEGGG